MAKQLFLNNFEWAFEAAVLSSPLTGTPATELGYGILQISLSASALMPNPTGGDFYWLTLFERSGSVESNYEIVRVLGVNEPAYSSGSETRIRVLRAQDGTPARAYAIGDFVSCRWTRGAANAVLQADDNLAGLTNQAAARTALDLGTAAVANTGTGAGNVVLGNDTRLADARVPSGAAGGVLGGTYPSPGFATPMATTADLTAAIATREATVTAGTTSQYWRGDKTWRDFFTDVRAAVLTGFSTASSAAVVAADTVLAAVGKLQAQVSARLPLAGGTLTGPLEVPAGATGNQVPRRNEVVLPIVPISINTTALAGRHYRIEASCELKLKASPLDLEEIELTNRSGTLTATIHTNGKPVRGFTGIFPLNSLTAHARLKYDATAGEWT